VVDVVGRRGPAADGDVVVADREIRRELTGAQWCAVANLKRPDRLGEHLISRPNELPVLRRRDVSRVLIDSVDRAALIALVA
jgi:hypothetical protein